MFCLGQLKTSKNTFQTTTFKVEENSRTFQGLAKKFKGFSRKNGIKGLPLKFKDFSRLCEPCFRFYLIYCDIIPVCTQGQGGIVNIYISGGGVQM